MARPFEGLLVRAGDYQVEPLQPPLVVPPLVEQERLMVFVVGFFVIVKVLPEAEVATQFDQVEGHCRDNAAFEIRIAADDT